jgi:formamidopyrimidine-DNA glycosylase
MPELPEVETYVRELAPELAGRTVVAARVFWPRTVAVPDAAGFSARIVGLGFTAFNRRGKYMLLGLSDGGMLLVHLRMTGKLEVTPGDTIPDKHTHLVLDLDDGRSLHYRDPRKFGRVWLVDDPAAVLAKLGPEPLSDAFSAADWQPGWRNARPASRRCCWTSGWWLGSGTSMPTRRSFRPASTRRGRAAAYRRRK